MAEQEGFELRAVFHEASDAHFPVLMATLGAAGLSVLVVPSRAHLADWFDVPRMLWDVDVWTLEPSRCWSRRPSVAQTIAGL